MTLLAGNPLCLVNGEEASIMAGATVPTAQLASSFPDGDVIIHESFKSAIATASTTNPNNLAVTLS